MKKSIRLLILILCLCFSSGVIACTNDTTDSSSNSSSSSSVNSTADSSSNSSSSSSVNSTADSSNNSSSSSSVNSTADSSNNSSSSSSVNSTADSSNNSSSSSSEELQWFTLATTIENCTIYGGTITFSVPYNTYTYSFVNSFIIPTNYKWELHWDQACLPILNIVSKTVDLEEGNNYLYALFINKNNPDDIYLYEIIVNRKPITQEEMRENAIGHAESYAEREYYEYNSYVTPYDVIWYLYENDYSYDIGYYVIEHCTIDWYIHAKRMTQRYLDNLSPEDLLNPDNLAEYIRNTLLNDFPEEVIDRIVAEIDWDTFTLS